MMRYDSALVTGGAGFIGHHLVHELVRQGKSVTVIDNLSMGRKENLPQEARFIHGDILDPNALDRAFETGPEAVYHLASKVTIRKSADTFVEDARTNILGLLEVLGRVLSHEVKKVIFSSSMAVYDDAPTPAPIDETHPIAPQSPYGISKLACEQYMANILAGAGVEYNTLRYFNTYGPNQTYTPYVGVITIFITKLLRGEPVTIFGNGMQCRDFVHVSDIVRGTLGAMEQGKNGRIYNLGTGQGTTVLEIAEKVCQTLNQPFAPQYAEQQATELVNSVAGIRSARQDFGYEPLYRFPQGLDEVIASVRQFTGA